MDQILDEKEITEKASSYAKLKLIYFKPFISSYEQAIVNAYVDGYVAGRLSNNDKMQPFLDQGISVDES